MTLVFVTPLSPRLYSAAWHSTGLISTATTRRKQRASAQVWLQLPQYSSNNVYAARDLEGSRERRCCSHAFIPDAHSHSHPSTFSFTAGFGLLNDPSTWR